MYLLVNEAVTCGNGCMAHAILRRACQTDIRTRVLGIVLNRCAHVLQITIYSPFALQLRRVLSCSNLTSRQPGEVAYRYRLRHGRCRLADFASLKVRLISRLSSLVSLTLCSLATSTISLVQIQET
jgi:hypothetical protein